jgi:hypothetical protein
MTLPKLQRTNELKASFGTVLGYGPAGAGKTSSILSLLNAGMNPFVIGAEIGETCGFLSLSDKNVPFVKVDDHATTIEVIRALKRKPGKCEYEGQEFGAVVLDSVTAWGEFPLDRFMELKGWEDLQTPMSGKDPRGAYGFLAEKGRQLYKELFEINAHLYIIAREGLFTGDAGEIFTAPELPGQKLPRELPGWPDATVRLRVIAGKHMMVTKGEGGSPARVRQPLGLPQLPLRCNPDIGALIKYMCGDRSMLSVLTPPKTPAEIAAAASAAAKLAAVSAPKS